VAAIHEVHHARVAAETELELARARRVRLAMIDRVTTLGSLNAAKHFAPQRTRSDG
jgi:hypothetical protein